MKRMSDNVYCCALASLLHDIGKPLQRARKSDRNTLSKDARGMEDLVKYPHSLWTADFFFRFRNKFMELEPVSRYGFENFQKLASKHHQPDSANTGEIIVHYADRASAGLDRVMDDDGTQKDSYIKKPLVSLFTRAMIEERIAPETLYYNLGKLEKDSVFPQDQVSLSSEQYRLLMDDFERDFSVISTKNPIVFLESVASLIIRYLWCVPSSTQEGYADIPLADHLLTTSAITAAMVVNYDETGKGPQEQSFRLVSGDFSGIQNFIFSLSGQSDKSIAKLLRGRSFMVNLYNILAARFVTEEFALPFINAITTAGGKFQIILPDIEKHDEVLANVRSEIESWTYNQFFGELRFILDNGVKFLYSDFKLEKFQEVFKKAGDSLNIAKAKPLSSVLDNPSNWVDNKRYSDLHKYKACRICGKEPGNIQAENIGTNCNEAIVFGSKLHRSEYMVIMTGDEVFNRYEVKLLPEISGVDLSGVLTLYKLNVSTSNQQIFPELHYSNYLPKHETGEPLTFEEIAEKRSKGLQALACLKADVDNMGLFFSEGFRDSNGKSTLSVSRVASVSRMVNWFFAGYLPDLLKNDEKFQYIYTLFAGGDDLCLIGPWDIIIECALMVRKEFARYTGKTPCMTLSAGVELFKPATPVSHAVENAEELLELSKDPSKGKNKITLFKETMSWDEELPAQITFAKDWEKFINETSDDKSINRNAMLYRFLRYHDEYRQAPENSMEKLKHRFRFVYDISRNLAPKNGEKDWRNEKPFTDLLITKTPNMEESLLFKYLPVGIAISAYKTRSKKETTGRNK